MTRGKTHAAKVKFIIDNKDKMSRRELAQKFNIHISAIHRIISEDKKKVKSDKIFDIDKDGSVFYF